MKVAYPDIFKLSSNMKPAIRRHTADSRTGRSMISPGCESQPWTIPQDIRDHNAEVERKKAEKRATKMREKLKALITPPSDISDFV